MIDRITVRTALILIVVLSLPSFALGQAGIPARQDLLKGPATTHFLGQLDLTLSDVAQTALALRASDTGFDYTPGDWTSLRSDSGYYHLGDFTLRTRVARADWRSFSSVDAREAVELVEPSGQEIAVSDLSRAFEGSGLHVRRIWENRDGILGLRFELTNPSRMPVVVGGVGIPMVFNNIMHQRTLDEAHAINSFHDPYIGQDAGYVQVVRLDGTGPALLVLPQEGSPFEAWRPLLDDRTARNITHEGFYEWMPVSGGYAEREWAEAEPWNPPTTLTIEPGESVSFGVRFVLARDVRHIEQTLRDLNHPVAVGLPGYVIADGETARLYIDDGRSIASIDVEPEGALTVQPMPSGPEGWHGLSVRGNTWGRSRVMIKYADGGQQSIHYKVTKPAEDIVDDMGRFLFNEQWYEEPTDPFGRAPSVISYDWTNRRQVTEDSRAWIAGLGDEGGSGSWLAAAMKQLIRPEPSELRQLEAFIDETLWGGLQYSEGPLRFGVRKSLFYYAPDEMPAGTYSDSVDYSKWSAWSKEHAATVERSYNYPHVAALYWTMYRLARNHEGLVRNHPWEWYLTSAFETSEAMMRLAPYYAQFGQMEGTVFLRILEDLQREGWTKEATALEATMKARALHWRSLGYPFGSEMPWDSTGQEEVYAWSRYFGFDEKALVTLNAILAYMPAVPHWGYNGSARRYWDFWYGGHPATSRLERQLHHYGSALNALPVLTEFRDHPDDVHLLRIGYAGMMGALANITKEGFAPAAFHAYPSTLAIDGYSGDYGPGFLGHALNVASYLVNDPQFGWQGFGGSVTVEDGMVKMDPTDSARLRTYIAPEGLWIELDAGKLSSVEYDASTGEITLQLDAADEVTPFSLIRISSPGATTTHEPVGTFVSQRGAWVIDLSETTTISLIRR